MRWICLGKKADNLTPLQKEALDLSLLGVHRIEALIKDLLDLERIERRVGLRLNQVRSDRDCADGGDGTDACRRSSVSSSLVYERSPARRFCVRGDAQRLYQVVSNLVSNAIKYTQPGGEITVNLRDQRQSSAA